MPSCPMDPTTWSRLRRLAAAPIPVVAVDTYDLRAVLAAMDWLFTDNMRLRLAASEVWAGRDG